MLGKQSLHGAHICLYQLMSVVEVAVFKTRKLISDINPRLLAGSLPE